LSKNIVQHIEELIEPILKERNVTLYDIEFVREGNQTFLRIYVDKEEGIDLTECGIVSELISDILDKEDPIKGAYFLEVSSPGAEKPLKTLQDYKDNINKNIYVSLYVHIDGEKEYEGILTEVAEDIVTIEYTFKMRKKQVQIPFDKIAKGRLAVSL